eukprot:COSAG01_NODE_34734_length_542_cov_147.875847_1_plen_38_part_01
MVGVSASLKKQTDLIVMRCRELEYVPFSLWLSGSVNIR